MRKLLKKTIYNENFMERAANILILLFAIAVCAAIIVSEGWLVFLWFVISVMVGLPLLVLIVSVFTALEQKLKKWTFKDDNETTQ